MKLTGKAKEKFEKWYNDNYAGYEVHMCLEWSEIIPSMQYGVYVDFFDSVGIYIDLDVKAGGCLSFVFFNGDLVFDGENRLRARHEARTAAIEKANEMLNSRL